jgi:hypothetical protein
MKTENKKRVGVILSERSTRNRRPSVVRRVKPVFVVFWIALWLVGAMHCPLETLGGLVNDNCCLTSPAAPDDPEGPAKSGCSYEESARRFISRTGNTTLVPVTIAKAGFPPSMRPTTITVIEPTKPGDEASFLPRSWQFRWRTALAPRAPSFLA